MRFWIAAIVGAALWTVPPAAAADPSLSSLCDTLRKVEREGKGNRAATEAWAKLVARCNADQLSDVLAAIDGAPPLGANWLRAAVDAVAEREWREGELATKPLEQFLADRRHDARARRAAYEWIVRADPTAAERLIGGFLDDPSLELRREAVAQLLTAAEAAKKAEQTDTALATYRQALDAARDLDQVKTAADTLKKLGKPVDLATVFGFLQDWKLIGPFDNVSGKGFERAYPPEVAVEPAASYEGKAGPVRWMTHHSDDENGQVDLNKAIGKHMGAVAYAVAEFQSDRQRPAELRLGTEAANKIWLNGKLLSFAQVYHANGTMDQYVARGELRKGKNVIVLKICQNEQTEAWAQDWKFQLRVCDAIGKAILSTDRPATHVAEGPASEAQTKE
jgi:hypothetical protein